MNMFLTCVSFPCKKTLNMFLYEFKSLMPEHNMMPQQFIINNLFVLSVGTRNSHQILLILVVTNNFFLCVKFHPGVQRCGETHLGLILPVTCNYWKMFGQRPKEFTLGQKLMCNMLLSLSLQQSSKCLPLNSTMYFGKYIKFPEQLSLKRPLDNHHSIYLNLEFCPNNSIFCA